MGLQSRSNTFVSDAVAGTVAAIEGARVGQVYNIGGGEELALLDAIRIIAGELGVEPSIRHEAARPGDQRRTWADTARARADFGYQPLVEPRAGLAEQVRWQVGLRALDRSSGA